MIHIVGTSFIIIFCPRQGGDLASVHSEGENNFITKFIENRPTRGGEKVNIEHPSLQYSSTFSTNLMIELKTNLDL